jgi:hypothetical protein
VPVVVVNLVTIAGPITTAVLDDTVPDRRGALGLSLTAYRPERVWSGFRSSAGPAGQLLGVRATIRHGTGVFSSR